MCFSFTPPNLRAGCSRCQFPGGFELFLFFCFSSPNPFFLFSLREALLPRHSQGIDPRLPFLSCGGVRRDSFVQDPPSSPAFIRPSPPRGSVPGCVPSPLSSQGEPVAAEVVPPNVCDKTQPRGSRLYFSFRAAGDPLFFLPCCPLWDSRYMIFRVGDLYAGFLKSFLSRFSGWARCTFFPSATCISSFSHFCADAWNRTWTPSFSLPFSLSRRDAPF